MVARGYFIPGGASQRGGGQAPAFRVARCRTRSVGPKSAQGQQLVQSRPKVGPKSSSSRPKVGPKLAQSWPKVGPKSAQSRPKVGSESAQSRPQVSPKSSHCWPEVGPRSLTSDLATKWPQGYKRRLRKSLPILGVDLVFKPGLYGNCLLHLVRRYRSLWQRLLLQRLPSRSQVLANGSER